MKTSNFLKLVTATLLGLVTLTPAFALAHDADVSVAADVTPTSVSVKVGAKLGTVEAKAVTRADNEIDRRIKALTDLNTRIQAMQKVTDTFKAGISASITNEVNTLTSLKAKIDADADTATLKTDVQSITASYRVFALVLPQGRIAAAADREVVLVSMMSTLGSKLQARIQAAAQAGATTSAMTAQLTDMASKLQDAQTKAEAAVTVSAALTPDGGDKTKMASNASALKEARADLKAAQTALVAARADATAIIKALASVKTSTTASTTTQ